MARATETPRSEAVLVAHGSPSDPRPQDDCMAELARAVAALAPGFTVRGATLAGAGSLESALAGLRSPAIYPFFMAEGYFTTDALPARLAHLHRRAHVLPAFGSDPALPELILAIARDAAAAHRLVPQQATLVLAAHGSQVSPASKRRTLEIVRLLADRAIFGKVTAGFIEEQPYLAEVAHTVAGGLCLPLFTLQAGHVGFDVPDALRQAGFHGHLLPHLGAHPAVPRLIAAALRRERRQVAA